MSTLYLNLFRGETSDLVGNAPSFLFFVSIWYSRAVDYHAFRGCRTKIETAALHQLLNSLFVPAPSPCSCLLSARVESIIFLPIVVILVLLGRRRWSLKSIQIRVTWSFRAFCQLTQTWFVHAVHSSRLGEWPCELSYLFDPTI